MVLYLVWSSERDAAFPTVPHSIKYQRWIILFQCPWQLFFFFGRNSAFGAAQSKTGPSSAAFFPSSQLNYSFYSQIADFLFPLWFLSFRIFMDSPTSESTLTVPLFWEELVLSYPFLPENLFVSESLYSIVLCPHHLFVSQFTLQLLMWTFVCHQQRRVHYRNLIKTEKIIALSFILNLKKK